MTITTSSPRASVPGSSRSGRWSTTTARSATASTATTPSRPAEYVAHHLLAARPLNYHSIPDHLYWKDEDASAGLASDDQRLLHPDRPGLGRGAAPRRRVPEDHPRGARPVEPGHGPRPAHAVRVPRHGPQRCAGRPTARATEATVVVVNDSPSRRQVASRLGGQVVLPPWGFVVEGPRFAAFLARRWNGRDYPDGRPVHAPRRRTGETCRMPDRVRIFHGFGDPRIDWRGTTHEVRREAVIAIPRPK